MFNVTEQVRKEIMSKCLKKAEILKIEMSQAYDIMATNEQVLPDDHEESISEINFYNGCPFERYVTKAEMLSFIQPLMGEGLTLASANKLQSLRKRIINRCIEKTMDL